MCAQGCTQGDLSKTLAVCPSLSKELQEKCGQAFQEEENYQIAHNAALVEAEGYGKKTRIEEILDFIEKMQYRKIGLLFCHGSDT